LLQHQEQQILVRVVVVVVETVGEALRTAVLVL
jgi:hypothetical protein